MLLFPKLTGFLWCSQNTLSHSNVRLCKCGIQVSLLTPSLWWPHQHYHTSNSHTTERTLDASSSSTWKKWKASLDVIFINVWRISDMYIVPQNGQARQRQHVQPDGSLVSLPSEGASRVLRGRRQEEGWSAGSTCCELYENYKLKWENRQCIAKVRKHK